LRELGTTSHSFWEKAASYTCKDLSSNFHYLTERKAINSLLLPRLSNDTFILNLGSGYPQRLIENLSTSDNKYYLLNMDISSQIIQKADDYCAKTGFQEISKHVYYKNLLHVENINVDFQELTLLRNLSRLKNEIKNEYSNIFLLAINSIQNTHVPSDEGINSIIKVIRFFDFADGFFATFPLLFNTQERLAYYLRNVKTADLVQLRPVHCDSLGKVQYGMKIEKMRKELLKDNHKQIIENVTHFSKEKKAKAVVLDFLTKNCLHTGFRTILITYDFIRNLFSSELPRFEIDLCGYPDEIKPYWPVTLPIAGGKKS
jgi:hypothetical protein